MQLIKREKGFESITWLKDEREIRETMKKISNIIQIIKRTSCSGKKYFIELERERKKKEESTTWLKHKREIREWMKEISNVIQILKREEVHVVRRTRYFIELERERKKKEESTTWLKNER